MKSFDTKTRRFLNAVLSAVLALQGILGVLIPQTAVAATQNAYRWRNDDGSEMSATWAAAENAPLNGFTKNIGQRLRMGIANSGSEAEFLKKTSISTGSTGDDRPYATITDAANGFIYYFTYTAPPKIIKFRLSDFTKASTTILTQFDEAFSSVSFDPTTGYAYASLYSNPGKILKIRLSDLTVTATLTLSSTGVPYTSVIDTAAGFVYFGTYTSPAKIFKIRLSDFSDVGFITLNSGENQAYGLAAIDPSGGYAYFGLTVSPGIIVRVRLSDFTRDGAITFSSGENTARAVVVDPAGGYLYVGLSTSPSKIIKIRLSDFTRITDLTFATGENFVSGGALDVAGDALYYSTVTSPAIIVKVQISTFSRLGAITFNSGENIVYNINLDVPNGYAYAATYTSPGTVVRIALAGFTRDTSLVLDSAGPTANLFGGSVIDPVGGFAYVGTLTSPARVVKLRLSDASVAGILILSTGNNSIKTGVIDSANGYAYFGTWTTPGKVIKVRLSDFTEVGALTGSSPNDKGFVSSAIDTVNGYAYFGCNSSPYAIMKLRLSDFTQIETKTFSATSSVVALFANAAGTTLYVGTYDAPIKVLKIQLSDFTETAVASLSVGNNNGFTGAFDEAGGYMYLGTYTVPGRVVKVRLSDLAEIGTAVLAANEERVGAVVVEPRNGFAYAVMSPASTTTPSYVSRVRTSDMVETGTMLLPLSEGYFYSGFLDAERGYAYFPGYFNYGHIVRVGVALHATPQLEYAPKSGTCAASTGWTAVSTAGGSAFSPAASTYVADGTPTTNVVGGVTDGNTVFATSDVVTASGLAPEARLYLQDFSEVEFALKPTAAAADGATYCFRITDAGTPLSTYSGYAEAVMAVSSVPTLANRVTLGRLKAGEVADFALSFTLQNTLSGLLTVSFPSGFLVNSAFTTGSCSGGGSIGTFGFTGTTLTAVKSSCAGTVALSGASVTNPPAPGAYVIYWVNDDPGWVVISILGDDAVTVSANVDPSLTFNVGTQALATACDGSFSGNGGTLAFGVLSPSAVTSSDAATVDHVCTRISTNATGGAAVTVKSLNAGPTTTSAPPPAHNDYTDTLPFVASGTY